MKGGIAVVHNGIIENHESLRRYLESTGARFVSQTDTEVIAHLLNHLYQGDMRRALIRAMGMLEGSYALGRDPAIRNPTLFSAPATTALW